MKESDVKAKIVKAVKDDGGYARRLEDQYAVGLPDMLLAVRRARTVMLVEAKIIRGSFFGPTPRQLEELRRINNCANEHVEALMLGYHPESGAYYFGTPASRLYCDHTLSAIDLVQLLDKLREL